MKLKLMAVLLLLGLSWGVRAETLVLIHGYLGGAQSWEQSGIVQQLEHHGWSRAGILVSGPFGIQHIPGHAAANATKRYVQVHLPSQAPLMQQSDTLSMMLDQIRLQQPDEALILVGHSAGGVVARMSMVRAGAKQIKALITIASPHVGTGRAAQALDLVHGMSPTSMLTNFFGGGASNLVRRSTGLLLDLSPPRPGSALHWLNAQAHPDITYVSVVRGAVGFFGGDDIVPAFSQDMNNVVALRGKSQVMVVPSDHYLSPSDAGAILQAVNGL